ncbi:hypothetical protein ACM26W_16285 [Halomonas sp. HK25]
MQEPRHTRPEPAPRDRYPDALRALAVLLVVAMLIDLMRVQPQP